MIIGAGLSGLIAAHLFPSMPIVEAQPEPQEMHKAVLRFRSDAVSRVTGIDFRQVVVRKGIYYKEEFHQPTINLANLYSQKCLGRVVGERSIWNLDPVQRWIAPEDFYWRMIEQAKARIEWNQKIDFNAFPFESDEVISTIPLPAALSQCGIQHNLTFDRSPIKVIRFRVVSCDVFQTVYFPEPICPVYRASITGDLLIVEMMDWNDGHGNYDEWHEDVCRAFGIMEHDLEQLDEVKQQYGKIAPVDDVARKHLIGKLSIDHNIFSLGRFATWKNLLLDDVVQDCGKIKQLINASSYDKKLHHL